MKNLKRIRILNITIRPNRATIIKKRHNKSIAKQIQRRRRKIIFDSLNYTNTFRYIRSYRLLHVSCESKTTPKYLKLSTLSTISLSYAREIFLKLRNV